MKCGKLTAKLRDAVPVRFYENGREIKRYKNIEIPDAIKELEFRDFRFDVPESGPITFKIFFAPGTLPETWPEARQRKTRTPKAADPEPMAEEPAQDATETPQEPAEPQAVEFRRSRWSPPRTPFPPPRMIPRTSRCRSAWRYTTT